MIKSRNRNQSNITPYPDPVQPEVTAALCPLQGDSGEAEQLACMVRCRGVCWEEFVGKRKELHGAQLLMMMTRRGDE